MFTLKPSKQYRKDIKRIVKGGLPIHLLEEVLETLVEGKPLAAKYNDHALKGKFRHLRECHIQPDWLLIYAIDKGNLILTATRTGSHSELFP